jgi:hypothetical protein
MNSFPLYESLFSTCGEEDLTSNERKDFQLLIEEIDQKGCEYAYVLIKMYANNNPQKEYKTFMVPYSGNYLGMNIQFDLDKFPNKLKRILYKFIKTHKQSMDETAKILQEADRLTQRMNDIEDLLI